MNRKQEVLCWVAGLAVVALLLEGGYSYERWLVPVAIVSALGVHGLRTRAAGDQRSVLAVGLLLAAVFYVGSRLEMIADSIPHSAGADEAIYEVSKSIDGLARATSLSGIR